MKSNHEAHKPNNYPPICYSSSWVGAPEDGGAARPVAGVPDPTGGGTTGQDSLSLPPSSFPLASCKSSETDGCKRAQGVDGWQEERRKRERPKYGRLTDLNQPMKTLALQSWTNDADRSALAGERV